MRREGAKCVDERVEKETRKGQMIQNETRRDKIHGQVMRRDNTRIDQKR